MKSNVKHQGMADGSLLIMKRFIWTLLLVFFGWHVHSQIQWNLHAGGGISYFEDFYQTNKFYKYQGGPVYQIGTTLSSAIRKGSLTEWETGLNLVNGSYYYIPRINKDGEMILDYDHKENIRD